MYGAFTEFGRLLFEQGLNNSHSGNMSVREADAIYITRHGARLSCLTFEDIVKTNLNDELRDQGASIETKVHRAIYGAQPAVKAIAHAHPPYGIVLSLTRDCVHPIDEEGTYYLKDIPVLSCASTIGSDEVATRLPQLFSSHRAVLVRGHGAFAVGKTLDEATLYLSVLESACRLIYLNGQMK